MFVCILSGVLTLSLISCIILSRSLDISGFDSSTGNWRDWMRWALKSLPARQAVIQIFSASVVPWQGTLLAVLTYLKMEHTASCLCNNCPEQIPHSCSASSCRRLLGWGWDCEVLCPALKSFLKSCHVTLKKIFLYNLTTQSQLYKATNRHSRSTPRKVFCCSAPALPHRTLIHNNNKSGLRF